MMTFEGKYEFTIQKEDGTVKIEQSNYITKLFKTLSTYNTDYTWTYNSQEYCNIYLVLTSSTKFLNPLNLSEPFQVLNITGKGITQQDYKTLNLVKVQHNITTDGSRIEFSSPVYLGTSHYLLGPFTFRGILTGYNIDNIYSAQNIPEILIGLNEKLYVRYIITYIWDDGTYQLGSNYTTMNAFRTQLYITQIRDVWSSTIAWNGICITRTPLYTRSQYYLSNGSAYSNFKPQIYTMQPNDRLFNTTIKASYIGQSKYIFNNISIMIGNIISSSIQNINYNTNLGLYDAIYMLPFMSQLDIQISTIFKQSILPPYTYTNTTALLSYSSLTPGQIISISSVSFNGFWQFSSKKDSQQSIHYILKVTNTGGNNVSKLIFKTLPYINTTSIPYYIQITSQKSMYSEFMHTYYLSGNIYFQELGPNTVSRSILTCQYPYYPYCTGYSIYNDNWKNNTPGIWCDSRRQSIDTSDTEAITMLLATNRNLKVYNHYAFWLPELIQDITFITDIIQCTYFYGEYILLSNDMKVYHLLENGSLELLLDTQLTNQTNMILVTHPDQDYCYLFAQNNQYVFDRNLDCVQQTTIAWQNLTGGFLNTNFDTNGYVWESNNKRSESTLELILSLPQGRCNFTYYAASNGTSYSLSGVQLLNVPYQEYNTNVYLQNLLWKYPQAAEVPLSVEDFVRLENKDVWYGRNLSTNQIEEYVASPDNSIPVINNQVEIQDNVIVHFDDDPILGTMNLVKDEYIYFTIQRGYIKDEGNEIEVRASIDLGDYHKVTYSYILDAGNLVYTIPEANLNNYPNFVSMNTNVFDCTLNGLYQQMIILTGTPTTGQVKLESIGIITFQSADIGYTVEFSYYYITVDI